MWFLSHFNIILATLYNTKRGKSLNIGRTFHLILPRFYLCFFKTVRQSVYYHRVAGTAAPRYIGYGRLKIEGRPHHTNEAVHIVEVHETTGAHIERTVRTVRNTGKSPFK